MTVFQNRHTFCSSRERRVNPKLLINTLSNSQYYIYFQHFSVGPSSQCVYLYFHIVLVLCKSSQTLKRLLSCKSVLIVRWNNTPFSDRKWVFQEGGVWWEVKWNIWFHFEDFLTRGSKRQCFLSAAVHSPCVLGHLSFTRCLKLLMIVLLNSFFVVTFVLYPSVQAIQKEVTLCTLLCSHSLLLLLSGHVEEHSRIPHWPAAPAAGSHGAGDSGWETQRTEASGWPGSWDPAISAQRGGPQPQQGDTL